MISATCAALAGVFPVLLFTIVFNGRGIRRRYRRGRIYAAAMAFGIVAGVWGLIAALVGVQLVGMGPGASVTTLVMGIIELVSLVVVLLLLANTYDIKDDNDLGKVGNYLDMWASKRRGTDSGSQHD